MRPAVAAAALATILALVLGSEVYAALCTRHAEVVPDWLPSTEARTQGGDLCAAAALLFCVTCALTVRRVSGPLDEASLTVLNREQVRVGAISRALFDAAAVSCLAHRNAP